MGKEIEIFFIPHCDDYCGLGVAVFDCPFCEKMTQDYGEVWYNFSECTSREAECQCDNCGEKFTIIKGEDFEYYLK